MEEQAVNTFYRELFIESRFLSHACMNESEAITFIVDEKNNISKSIFKRFRERESFSIVCSRQQQQVLYKIGFFSSLAQIRMEMK